MTSRPEGTPGTGEPSPTPTIGWLAAGAGSPGGALAGLRVLDFSRVLAGPYATMLLADLGADVIKVERPGTGDDTRAWGPPYGPDGQATYFAAVNRNKRSTCLDLKEPRDLFVVRGLAECADVVVENFTPGTMARLGLGYEDLRRGNPALVYASISGFGPEAGAALPGYDLLVQAMGGLMSVTGPDPQHPTKAGVAILDVVTGLHALVGILAALTARRASGVGQQVSVNLLSSTLSALVNQSQSVLGGGVVPHAMGNAHPSIAPYETFPTASGVLTLAVGNDQQFRSLCATLGAPGLAGQPRFSSNPERVRNRAALAGELTELLATDTATHWAALLMQAGVPAGPVNDIATALELAQQLGLHPVVDAGGVPTVANPITLSRTPVDYRLPPPDLPQR